MDSIKNGGSFEIIFNIPIQERSDDNGKIICDENGKKMFSCKFLTSWDVDRRRVCLVEEFAMKPLDDGYLLFKHWQGMCVMYVPRKIIFSLKYCESGNDVISNLNSSAQTPA